MTQVSCDGSGFRGDCSGGGPGQGQGYTANKEKVLEKGVWAGQCPLGEGQG